MHYTGAECDKKAVNHLLPHRLIIKTNKLEINSPFIFFN
jgi:hypothetical protein